QCVEQLGRLRGAVRHDEDARLGSHGARVPLCIPGVRSAQLVGREVGVPVAERTEGAPELALRLLVVERAVDVRHGEGLDRWREALELARLPLELAADRDA